MVLVLIAIIAAAAYMLAYVRRRRFGVLGLCLVAGVLLNNMYNSGLAEILRTMGVVTGVFTPQSMAAFLLVLLPSIVALINGPKYPKRKQARLGAAAFAVAVVLMLVWNAGGMFLSLDASYMSTFASVMKNSNYILTGCIVGAMVDLLFVKPPAPDTPGTASRGKGRKKKR